MHVYCPIWRNNHLSPLTLRTNNKLYELAEKEATEKTQLENLKIEYKKWIEDERKEREATNKKIDQDWAEKVIQTGKERLPEKKPTKIKKAVVPERFHELQKKKKTEGEDIAESENEEDEGEE